MSRPSAHLDRRLVSAARAMLPETGFSGLSVREAARRAGVNAGMFHYHFKTKEAFLRRVLRECYEDFLQSFREAADPPGTSRARLRRVLVAFGRFGRDNRVMYTLMLRELLNAQPEMYAFARENFPRHTAAVMSLIEDCRREGTVRPLPVPMLAMFAMSTMGLPNVVVTGLERNRVRVLLGRTAAEFSRMLLSDEMIEARADMAMAALAPARRG
ncbi:MAG TPA: TetR/AcrR family transcriptional regulator [Elusimicrobiota bacterium]|jgi:AcrR family transcriptional regulator|nr:TetR/AcrR family transcriptional regulator [Elusimicrobiota bacterium]